MRNIDLLWTHTIAAPFLDYIITGNASALTQEEREIVEAYIEEYETRERLLLVLNPDDRQALEECKVSGEMANCHTLAIYQDNTDYGYNGIAFDI